VTRRRVEDPVVARLPQRCPYCLQDAAVESVAIQAALLVRGCACAGEGGFRVWESLARRRWRELGVD
jgi:hypothetical protein